MKRTVKNNLVSKDGKSRGFAEESKEKLPEPKRRLYDCFFEGMSREKNRMRDSTILCGNSLLLAITSISLPLKQMPSALWILKCLRTKHLDGISCRRRLSGNSCVLKKRSEMAVTKLWKVSVRLGQVLDYATES